MPDSIGKDEWIAMFKEIGLDDDTMVKWHRLFEKRHPGAHENFLAWLGMAPDEIAKVRMNCR